MKKLFTSTFVAMLLAVVLPVTAFAAETLPESATVTVTCPGGDTGSGVVNPGGSTVQVPDTFNCDNNTTVNLFAVAEDGTYTGTGIYRNGDVINQLNVELTNPTQVPEFGLLTGAVAMLTSGGSLLAFRRMRKA